MPSATGRRRRRLQDRARSRPSPAILNLSTRLKVETGDNVLIGGFIVTGSDERRSRSARHRTLAATAGIPARRLLPNPKLELHDSSGALIASNDNWMDSPQKDEIISRSLAPDNDLGIRLARRAARPAATPPS